MGFPCGSAGKESTCNAGDLGLVPQLGRSLAEGKSHPLQYSGLEDPMECIDHGVAKSWTWQSSFHFHYGLFKFNFMYLFYFGRAGSSLLCVGFLSCSERGPLSSCGVWASPRGGFSCCGAWALAHSHWLGMLRILFQLKQRFLNFCDRDSQQEIYCTLQVHTCMQMCRTGIKYFMINALF